MTSPGHVRNDFWREHVVPELPIIGLFAGPNLESVGEKLAALRLIEALSPAGTAWPSLPREFLAETNATNGTSYPVAGFAATLPGLNPAGLDASRFWSSEGAALEASLSGLAERVATEFLSRGSLSNAPPNGYASPSLPGECDVLLPLREIGGEAELYPFIGAPISRPYVSSPLVPHLAACNFHWAKTFHLSGGLPDGEVTDYTLSVIDSSVQRDYMELLFSLAIDYTEKFISFYFSPRLEVVPAGPGQFRLRNRSQLEFRADATAIEIAYDVSEQVAPEGTRAVVPVNCGSGEIVLPPAPAPGGVGPLSAAVCEMPLSLAEPPADVTSFWVVARGKLGERGQVATRDELEGGQADFVVAFDRVLPQLLLLLHQGPDLGPDEDLRNDIWALDVDLVRTLPEGEENEITDFARLENLTERLRGADGSPLLDFVVPAVDPRGRRIALWSDRDASYATGSPFGVAAPLRLYLYDRFKEPPSLVPIPSGEVETQPDHWFLPRWSDNGEALFFRAPGQARYMVASQTGESFDTEEAFSTSNDDAPEVLEIGDERDVCSRIDFLSARDAAQVVVSTLCRRERVTHKEELISGGFRIDWSPITPTKREVRIAVVETSLEEPPRLHARLTHRVDVASAALVACGGEPNSCWERSGEPDGEEGAEELSPVWAPDGTRFAFLRDPTGGDDGALASGGEELWVADLASRDLRRVLTRDRGDLYRLAWHPSGDRLLVGLATADRYDVVTVDPDGPETQVPGRLARFRNQGSSRFSLYAPLLLPLQAP